MGFLSDSKDRVVENMVLPVLNKSLLAPYGKATALRINSTAKMVDLNLELRGETQPVQIQIKSYELLRDGETAYAVIKAIQTSRAWLTTLAEQHLVNRPLKLPPKAAKILWKLL